MSTPTKIRILTCELCNQTFQNLYKRRFCSKVCAGRRPRSSHFGQIPAWNKGTKGLIKPNSGSFKKGERTGESHPLWKGDNVGYHALHTWVIRSLGSPRECENCGTLTAKKYEWANLSGEYKRDLSDWARLCVSCHQMIDGHRYKMWETIRCAS